MLCFKNNVEVRFVKVSVQFVNVSVQFVKAAVQFVAAILRLQNIAHFHLLSLSQ